MATIGDRIKKKTEEKKVDVSFARGRRDSGAWFDMLLPRVRSLRAFLDDAKIAEQILRDGEYSAEEIWLCLNAAAILDGKRD